MPELRIEVIILHMCKAAARWLHVCDQTSDCPVSIRIIFAQSAVHLEQLR